MQPRLAELIGSLSLATDLAVGLAMETALRTSLIAVELGRALGERDDSLRDLYYTGLLRFLGCTAYAHESAAQLGDDLEVTPVLGLADGAHLGDVVGRAVRGLQRNKGPLRRVRAVVKLLGDPKGQQKFARAHCDQAVTLSARLGMNARVAAALAQMYERFDGKGHPHRVAGERIDLAARVMHVAFCAEVHRALEGPAAALAVVKRRAGGELDPRIAAAFLGRAPSLLPVLSAPSVWDAFLAAEPEPHLTLPPARVGELALAFAHFVDLKSPFTLGHSTGVATLADAAAAQRSFSDGDRQTLRIAAWLHDLGRVAVANDVWDKPGPLNVAERERVRLHAYQTERVLAQSPLFAPYAAIAAAAHERCDGSGYHRGLTTGSAAARILAAADVYTALGEARPHRPAFAPAAAATLLADEARAGKLDRDAVEAVLAAAGHATRVRGARPMQLTEREVEVLCLLARGLSNKEIGKALFISPKTVKRHVEHIYEKTGVSTRAAAALFAVENSLV